MNDLRVLFAAADIGYRAQLADAKGRRLGVEVPFTPFLSEDDYEDLRWYLEETESLAGPGRPSRFGDASPISHPSLRREREDAERTILPIWNSRRRQDRFSRVLPLPLGKGDRG
jgi:hypothetical protein